MKDNKLLPCPFCGGEALIKTSRRYPSGKEITAYSPTCYNMACVIYDADDNYYRTEQEAIEAWNRRANNE